MANICDNKFYFSCEHNFDNYSTKINKILDENLDGEVTFAEYYNDEGGWMEGYFDSRWCFPDEIFSEFLNEESIKDGVYFRCLSEEYGCGYVAMNIFDEDGWRDTQTFDL